MTLEDTVGAIGALVATPEPDTNDIMRQVAENAGRAMARRTDNDLREQLLGQMPVVRPDYSHVTAHVIDTGRWQYTFGNQASGAALSTASYSSLMLSSARPYGGGGFAPWPAAYIPAERYETVDTSQADRKARDLLVRKLSPEQWDEYEKQGYFTVIGSDTKAKYRIKFFMSHNVFKLNKDGDEVQSLCAGPTNVPLGDYLLAQKMWIEMNEKHFVKKANKNNLR